jgi:hypothetical protein
MSEYGLSKEPYRFGIGQILKEPLSFVLLAVVGIEGAGK